MSPPWNRHQQIALAIIPKFTSLLSLMGSSWIITEVLTDKTESPPKRKQPYHRLLFAMSSYDVLESVWNFMSTWPIPQGTDDVIWATGTQATCSAQGFFLTLSVAVPIYNAMLSLYYVLVINYHCSDESLRKWVEPTMHVVAGGWAFGTAIYSASTGLLNNANIWCWIAPLPTDCLDSWRYGDEGNCIRGDNAWIYRWSFYFAPLWFCIFLATVCIILVYRFVRRLDKDSVRYRNPHRVSILINSLARQQPPRRTNSSNDGLSLESNDEDLPVVRKTAPSLEPGQNQQQQLGGSSSSGVRLSVEGNLCSSSILEAAESCRSSNEEEDSSSQSSRSNYDHSEKREQTTNNCGNQHGGNTDRTSGSEESLLRPPAPNRRNWAMGGSVISESVGMEEVPNRYQSWQSLRQISREKYQEDYPRTLEVFYQACFYLGVFYLTHVWSTTNRITQQVQTGSTYFGIIAAHAFFDPLQGFLNYFVYQRPRFLRIRKHYPEAGRLGALYRMLRFSCLPDPQSWDDQRTLARSTTERK